MTAAARAARVDQILGHLVADDDIAGCALISHDGLLLGSAMEPAAEGVVGHTTARLLAHAGNVARNMGFGELAEVTIRGDAGHVVFARASRSTLLVAIVRLDATPEWAMLNVRHAASLLAEA